MNRDEVLEALFRHALLMHGFATGALLRDRSLNAKAIFTEMEPHRARLVALYVAAGFEVPEALQADQRTSQVVTRRILDTLKRAQFWTR